jgi:hypothetical protein
LIFDSIWEERNNDMVPPLPRGSVPHCPRHGTHRGHLICGVPHLCAAQQSLGPRAPLSILIGSFLDDTNSVYLEELQQCGRLTRPSSTAATALVRPISTTRFSSVSRICPGSPPRTVLEN